jgi:rhomboid protease GluP
MNDMTRETTPARPSPTMVPVSLPVHKPIVTYVLLAAIGIAFLLEMLLGGSTSMATLYMMGAQVNREVANGDYWRLLTAMFLHIGPMHLAFNAFALYSLGADLERYYGSVRFALIYFLSGLIGGVLYFVVGPPNVLSAGASGAVFGIVGAELAYIVSNRRLFGSMGRQRLTNLVFLLGINLVLGFTVSGINNIVHIGGFLAGLGLGFALTPRYGVGWDYAAAPPLPMVEDHSSRVLAAGGVVAAMALLAIGLQYGG